MNLDNKKELEKIFMCKVSPNEVEYSLVANNYYSDSLLINDDELWQVVNNYDGLMYYNFIKDDKIFSDSDEYKVMFTIIQQCERGEDFLTVVSNLAYSYASSLDKYHAELIQKAYKIGCRYNYSRELNYISDNAIRASYYFMLYSLVRSFINLYRNCDKVYSQIGSKVSDVYYNNRKRVDGLYDNLDYYFEQLIDILKRKGVTI